MYGSHIGHKWLTTTWLEYYAYKHAPCLTLKGQRAQYMAYIHSSLESSRSLNLKNFIYWINKFIECIFKCQGEILRCLHIQQVPQRQNFKHKTCLFKCGRLFCHTPSDTHKCHSTHTLHNQFMSHRICTFYWDPMSIQTQSKLSQWHPSCLFKR